MRYVTLMDDGNCVTAVGPFADSDQASKWGDSYETGTVTAVGTIPLVRPGEFAREHPKVEKNVG